jgi:sugar lactone lactonase YvrE
VDASDRIYVVGKESGIIRVIHRGQVTTLNSHVRTTGQTDGPVKDASFNYPRDLAVSASGDVYVADFYNCQVRRISGGMVSTLAGDGNCGFQDGPAATARFNRPEAVAVDSSGKVYVGDTKNHRIRQILGGQVSTLAGTGVGGRANGPALSATFYSPMGLAVDSKGTVFVLEYGSLRKIADGQVAQVVTGEFYIVYSLSAGPADELYVTEHEAIYKVSQGTNGSRIADSLLGYPRDVAVDSRGRLIIADAKNHQVLVFYP